MGRPPRAGPLDDAASCVPNSAPPRARSLVLTVDVITPIVDDPRDFGGIAAANALSDVYAMGGRPEVALSFVGFPTDKLPLEVLAEVLAGMRTSARARRLRHRRRSYHRRRRAQGRARGDGAASIRRACGRTEGPQGQRWC